MDPGTAFLIIIGVALLFLVLDLLLAGGAMTGGMMGGMMMAASTPFGAIILLIAFVLVGFFAYLAFFT